MKKYYKYSIFSLLFVFIFSCSEYNHPEYIELPYTFYSFKSDGSDTLFMSVEANAEGWKAESSDNFVRTERISEDSIKIWCSPNQKEKSRSGVVFFSIGNVSRQLEILQLPHSFNGRFEVFPITAHGMMSKNGKWFAYVDVRLSGNEWKEKGYLVDMKTGERSLLDVPKPKNSSRYYDSVVAISDDASTIVYMAGGILTTVVVNGKEVDIKVPEGYTTPSVRDITSDGTKWAGFCMKGKKYYPTIWINGEPEILEQPLEDVYHRPVSQGTILRGISEDGSLVYGSEWSSYGLIYWQNGKMNNIGIDNSYVYTIDGGVQIAEMIQMQAQQSSLSNDGRYITCKYRKVEGYDGKNYQYVYYPVIIDTKTGTYEVFDSTPDVGGYTFSADGRYIFGSGPVLISTTGYVLDSETGVCIGLNEWFMENYSILIEPSYWVQKTSRDMKSFMGRCLSTASAMGVANPYWYLVLE